MSAYTDTALGTTRLLLLVRGLVSFNGWREQQLYSASTRNGNSEKPWPKHLKALTHHNSSQPFRVLVRFSSANSLQY